MAAEAVLRVKVIADATSAALGLDKVDKSASKMRRGLSAAAVPAAAAGAAVLAFGKASVDAASATQQAMGAVDAVFGKSSDKVKAWAEGAADSVGLAASEYANMASLIGSQLQNMGVPMDKVAGKTNDLIKMSADLAAQYGGTTAEAVEALSSALRGETDPIEKYAVGVKQADIAARMAADGTDKLEGAAGKNAKTQALLALITEDAANANNAYARESGSAAQAAQESAAQMENMQSAIGEALLPAVSAAAEALGKFFGFLAEHKTLTQVLIGIILALAAAIVVMNVAMAVAAVITAGMVTPILIVIAVVIALVAATVLVVKHFDTLKAVGTKIWEAIKSAATAVAQAIARAWKTSIEAVKRIVRSIAQAWQAAMGAVRGVVSAVTNWIKRTWQQAVNAVARAVDAVTSAWDSAMSAIRGAVSAVVGFLKSAWTSAVNTVGRAIRSLGKIADGVFGAIRGAMAKVWSVFSGLGEKIRGLMAGASGWLVSVGRDIVMGLVHGIQSVYGMIQSAVSALADKIPGWVKKRLGIASPSKVMAAIGTDITEGLVVGMAEGVAGVEAIAEKMGDSVVAAIEKAEARALAEQKRGIEKRLRAMEQAAGKSDKAQKRVERAKAKAEKEIARLEKASTKSAQTRSAAVLAAVADETAALRINATAREDLSALIDEEQDKLKSLIDTRNAYSASLRDSALAYGSVTQALGQTLEGEDIPITADNMAAAMAARVAGVQSFVDVLDQLRGAGLAEDLIADLAAAGVEGGLAQAQAIAAGGPAAVAQFNALQATLTAAATALGEKTADGMYAAGIQSQQALVQGLTADLAGLEAAAVVLAQTLADAIAEALKAELKNIKITVKGGKGKGGNNRAAPLTLVPAAPTVPTARAGASTSTSGGITVNVTGAIDPEATARQIRRILRGHDRRQGLAS